jgi:hypothetical protein
VGGFCIRSLLRARPNQPIQTSALEEFSLEDCTVNDIAERRAEKRLRYNWPIWFAEDYNDSLIQGQMVDVSSGGAAFTCYADRCPRAGDRITARFSVPRYGAGEAFDLENFMRSGHICRVDELSSFVRRVAVRFGEPLPFKPGEIEDTEALAVNVPAASAQRDENGELTSIEEREAAAMAEPLQVQTTTESVGT